MRFKVMHERGLCLFSKQYNMSSTIGSVNDIELSGSAMVVMGSGSRNLLSDAMTCVQMGLANQYSEIICFDPGFYIRLPKTLRVDQAKYFDYINNYRRLPKTVVVKDGFYPKSAEVLFEKVKSPLNVLGVSLEGSDAVVDTLIDLAYLIPHGIIGQMYLFDPIRYDYKFLTTPNIKVKQEPVKVTPKTPESFIYGREGVIWRTNIFGNKIFV